MGHASSHAFPREPKRYLSSLNIRDIEELSERSVSSVASVPKRSDLTNLLRGYLRHPVAFSLTQLRMQVRRMMIPGWPAFRMQSATVAIPARDTLWFDSADMTISGCCTTFGGHVSHVVFVGAEKEMIGSNTRSNVASMKNEQIVRNGSEREFIRESMREDMAIETLKTSISSVGGACGPQPAIGSFSDFSPKSRDAFVSGKWSRRHIETPVFGLLRGVGAYQCADATTRISEHTKEVR